MSVVEAPAACDPWLKPWFVAAQVSVCVRGKCDPVRVPLLSSPERPCPAALRAELQV